MISRLLKAIRGDQDEAEKRLRAVVAQNDADREWIRKNINGLSEKLQAEHDSARVALIENACDETLAVYLQKFPNNSLVKCLSELTSLVQESVAKRCMKRTLQPLRDSLESAEGRLHEEREQVAALEEKTSARLGLPHSDSPTVTRIDTALGETRRWLDYLKGSDLTWPKVQRGVKFALGEAD